MKKYLNINFLIIITIILLCFMCFLTGVILSINPKLGDFKIDSLDDVDGKLTIITDKSLNAIKYEAFIYDEEDNLIASASSDSNRIPIELTNVSNGEMLKVNVTAINIKNSELKSSNTFDYIVNDPTFDNKASHIVTKDKIYGFDLQGNIDGLYHIDIIYQNQIIKTINVTNNYVYLKYADISSYKGRLTANLVNDRNRILSTFNFYNDPTIVSDVKITTPNTVDNIGLEDIILTYNGGQNATNVVLNIKNNNKIVKTIDLDNVSKQMVITANNFTANTQYTLEVVAEYEDYKELSKSDAINIQIGDTTKVSPVYINHYEAKIKKGTQVKLSTKTEGAEILYTLDGKDPSKYGKTYNEPIVITSNVILKTIAIKNSMDNSDLETYDFKISDEPKVIYLSPSSQNENYGVKSAGYTTEMEWMNKVGDVVEDRLKAAGATVYRNNPYVEGKMNIWLAESRKVKSDLHIAIHSNASHNHDAQGVVDYVDDYDSLAYSFANVLYNNLYSIYPYQSSETNLGVKYARGALGEVSRDNISRGVLIETAFHDNYDDAKWIVDNYEEIGENIANSIIDFYQIGG
jgi:N-acetylmuramoyl-L-alanine amidase